jgi:hypothetical protein
MLFELPDAKASAGKGEWDRFQIRNLGLAMQKRMARKFQGDARRMRAHSIDLIERRLGVQLSDGPEGERAAQENFALLLAMMPIDDWDSSDKQTAGRILRAKVGGDEALYLKLMQKHSPLRAEVIRLGS